jgi:anthranilate phosphoribosyltransferase
MTAQPAVSAALTDIIHKLTRRENLSEAEAQTAMNEIMSGLASDIQIAAFLTALRMKGETAAELVGFAKTMRAKAEPFWDGKPQVPTLDTCGTGGDGAATFNISTASAFVAAGAGARVAKHGNRSTRGCGSAGVLEALGVDIQMPLDKLRSAVSQIGFGFLFAPRFHSATKHAMPARNQLKMPTVFNILGPLANPARPEYQVVGVFSQHVMNLMAEALVGLGVRHAFVVHGADGMDEASISAPTHTVEIRNGVISRRIIAPEDFGVSRASAESIASGDAAQNAAAIEAILGGERGPRRDVVLMNTAVALTAAGVAETLEDGFRSGNDAIESGRALATLRAVQEASR